MIKKEHLKNKVGRTDKLKANKRFMTLLIVGILVMSGSVLAFYILSYGSITTYTIQGGVTEFTITQDLTNQILDVSQNLSSTQALIITNDNGNLSMVYNLTIDSTELDSGNCDASGDILFELKKDSVVIPVSGNFTMNNGVNTFEFKVESTTDRACPQIINATLIFS